MQKLITYIYKIHIRVYKGADVGDIVCTVTVDNFVLRHRASGSFSTYSSGACT